MKVKNRIPGKTIIQGRPDYYITPTRDFTQYTKDSEEKYWSKDTRFDWHQNIAENLEKHLKNLDQNDYLKITLMVLPMVHEALIRNIVQIRHEHLPLERDALKNISECIPSDRKAIHDALLILTPLKALESSVSKLKDQAEILNGELLDLLEQQRLGFFKKGAKVKLLETEAEREEQSLELSRLTNLVNQTERDLEQIKTRYKTESDTLKTKIRDELHLIEPQVLVDLEET